MSGALVFMPRVRVLAAVTQGMTLECLALVAGGACVPDSHSTLTIRETVLNRLPHRGYCTDSRHTPRLSVEEACVLVLQLQPEG